MPTEPFFDDESQENFAALVAVLKNRGDAAFFIGAGLSVPAMPNWKQLFEGLQEDERLQPAQEFDPESAPIDFASFRETLGDDDYLGKLKDLFGKPQEEYPVLYRVLDEIPGVRCLITTNFDEFVAMCAEESTSDRAVSTFPEFRPVNARFIYLHGRVSTADNADEIVLCSNAYAQAYWHPRAPAALELVKHLVGDMVFVGCSMDDPDLRRILEDLQRLRMVSNRSLGPKPYAILPVDPNWPLSKVTTLNRRLRFYGVRPIWYEHDGDYAELSTVLRKLQQEAQPLQFEDVYLEQTNEIDSLSSKLSPEEADGRRLLELVEENPALMNHFLRNASSPAWYETLLENGFLTEVVEPAPDDEGRIQLRSWAAAPYVGRIARERPEAVVELTSLLSATKNWHVQGVLSGLATWLDDEQLHEAMPALKEWRRSEYARTSLIDLNLVTLFTSAAGRRLSTAFHLLEELLQTQNQGELGGQGMESYHVEQMEPGVQSLIASDPQRAYELLKENLVASLDDEGLGLFARAAIEDHEQNATHFHPLWHARIAWTRDALLTLIREDPEVGRSELNTLNTSNEELLVRLALHAIRSHPEYIEKLDEPIVSYERVFEPGLFHEMMLILRDRLAALPDDQQQAVHRAVREGPPGIQGESVEDREGHIETWRRSLLGKIPIEKQSEEEAQWRTDLGIIPHDTEELYFRFYSTTGWVAETIEEPDLSSVLTEGIEQLLSYLREEPRRWRGLRQLVQSDPQARLELARHFEPQDFAELGPFLEAYGDSAMSHVGFSWGPLIELCERMVSAPQAPGEFHFSSVARLLRNGLGTAADAQGVPLDLRERALATCAKIVDQDSIPLTEGLPGDRQSSSHQLNSAAGDAADALLWYVELETQRSEAGQGIPAAVAKYVQEAVDEAWGGIEMRHALGQFAGRLEWFEPGWADKNLNSLFPGGDDSDSSLNARRAFVNGYLLQRPTTRLMETFRPMYEEVILDTGREEPLYLDDTRLARTPFAEQVMVGWIWDLDGFGLDGLVGELIGVADQEMLEHLVWFLGSQYANGPDGDYREKLWNKMDEYWNQRMQVAESLEDGEESRELTRFCAWVRDTDVPLSAMEGRLPLCIDHADINLSLYVLLDGLTERAASEPADASRLLQYIVERWINAPELAFSEGQLSKAVDALCAVAGEQEEEIIKQVVVKLHQNTVIDFRDRLANFGEQTD